MQLSNGNYQIQGLNITDICQQFGTPLYVYDANIIIRQINNLKNAFHGVPLKIKFACKALTNLSVMKLMKMHGVGVDTVSVNEARLALMAGFIANEINYTPNGVAFEEIMEAVSLGIRINIDNLSTLEKFGKQYGNAVKCGLRLNPHIVAGGNSKIQVGHIDSKFGISVSQLNEIQGLVEKYNLQICGLHIHTGSDILEAESFIKGAEVVFEIANNFNGLEYIDFGGGFKVAYKEGDKTTDMEGLGEKLTSAFKNFCNEYGRPLELWFEPGKYLVSECGYPNYTLS